MKRRNFLAAVVAVPVALVGITFKVKADTPPCSLCGCVEMRYTNPLGPWVKNRHIDRRWLCIGCYHREYGIQREPIREWKYNHYHRELIGFLRREKPANFNG